MISTLTGSASSKIKNKWSTVSPYVTGYDVYASTIYSVTYGKVMYVGQEPDGTFTISIACNSNEMFRYSNVIQLFVGSSDIVTSGTKLGVVDKYVHFEYISRWQGESRFPVRVNQYLYFKQDPHDILEGTYMPSSDLPVQYDPSRNRSIVTYDSDTQEYEFKGVK